MSALRKAVTGAAKAGKKAATKTAKAATPPGPGGFPRGSMDSLLYMLSQNPNDAAIKQQILQMAGSNPAMIQKIRPFGLGPAAGGGLKPQRTGMLGTIMNEPKKAAVGAGAGLGLAGLGLGLANMGGKAAGAPDGMPTMMASHGEEEQEPEPYSDMLFGDTSFDPTKIAPSPMRSGVAGRSRPAMPRPKPSALSGINGAGDMSDLGGMDFGVDSSSFDQTISNANDAVASSQASLDKFNQPKKGGGFGGMMGKIGPLIAALMAGRMMR